MSNSDRYLSHEAYGVPYTPDALNYTQTDSAKLLFRADIESVGYVSELEDWAYPDVFSPFWRLYYNSKPGKSIQIGPSVYTLTPGNIVFVPPHIFFNCISEESTDHLWIHFSLPVHWRADYDMPLSVPTTTGSMQLIQQLHTLDFTPDSKDRIVAYSIANALVYLAISALAPPRGSTIPTLLQVILEEIDFSRGRVGKLSEIANRCHTSERNLRRLFVKHLGISPSNYIQGTKIRHATRLLKNENLSIEQIAEQCGFSDRFHFSKSFRNQLGITPVQYRNTLG